MIEATDGARTIPLTRMDNADPALMDELLATVERVARSASTSASVPEETPTACRLPQ